MWLFVASIILFLSLRLYPYLNSSVPLGYDAGIRTMERTIEGVVRKVARLIVEGKGTSFTVTLQNIKEFLPL